MLDRVLKLIVVLTLLLFLVQSVIGVLCRILEAALGGVATTLGSGAASLVIAIAAICFLAGAIGRGFHFIANRDPRMARERASRDRAMRQRPRRPAEGVSPVGGNKFLDDPDPAVGADEDDR
ncbi:MAG: hypothetical protein ABI960_00740 [Candidatus Eisenbacteria bacterium]